jgi:hypothetical protein
MQKLEKLTPEQEIKMFEVRDFWIDYIDSCKNSINKEQALIGIKWLYEGINKKTPLVLFVASPMGCQIGVHYLKELYKDNVWANVRANVRDNVRDNVGANVRDNVVANVWANVGDNVRANVWANVGDNVRANVWANVGDNLVFESFASYGSISDYDWVAFYDYFTQIGVLNHEGFNQFKNLIYSGIYDMIQMDGVCVVCELPSKLIRDENQQMNSIEGFAIEFKDGYGQYYINGRYLSEEVFLKLKTRK